MEKIIKVTKNSLNIPKMVIDHLNCNENDLVKWELNENRNVVKFYSVNYKDYPNVRTDNFYIENGNVILYRRFYKQQGATAFPAIIRNYMNFEKNHRIKWVINDKNEVLIDKIETIQLTDLSGIVEGVEDNV